MIRLSLYLALLLFVCIPVQAQPDIAYGQTSLGKIKGFYLRVDVEGSLGLTNDPQLNARAIRSRLQAALTSAGLNVLQQTEVMDDNQEPYLYVHVNMLDLGDGNVPFSISTQFYQKVNLTHQRGTIVAATWDTGLVGITNYNELDLIAETAESSLVNFISDYHTANP